MTARVELNPNVTISWAAVMSAAQAEQKAQEPAQPTATNETPLERAIHLIEAAEGGRPWNDDEARRVGISLWHEKGDLEHKALQQRQEQMSEQTRNLYGFVYWGYALKIKYPRGWRKMVVEWLGADPRMKQHTIETYMPDALAVAPEHQMTFVVWPSMYLAVGHYLPVKDGQDGATNERHTEAQGNLLAWAEAQLRDCEPDERKLTVKQLERIAEKMQQEGLTEVPLMDDGGADNAPDEQALLIGTLQGQVAALAGLVDTTIKTMVDLCAPDPDLYSRAFRQGNMLMVKKARILGGQVQADDAMTNEESEA